MLQILKNRAWLKNVIPLIFFTKKCHIFHKKYFPGNSILSTLKKIIVITRNMPKINNQGIFNNIFWGQLRQFQKPLKSPLF